MAEGWGEADDYRGLLSRAASSLADANLIRAISGGTDARDETAVRASGRAEPPNSNPEYPDQQAREREVLGHIVVSQIAYGRICCYSTSRWVSSRPTCSPVPRKS